MSGHESLSESRNPVADADGNPLFDPNSVARYEIGLLVGPCRESEAEDFLLAVVEFANSYRTWAGNSLGPVGSIGPWTEAVDA